VDLSFLSLIFFIAVIASLTQILEMILERYVPSLHVSLGIYLPLLAVHCAVFAGSLFMQQKGFGNVGMAAIYGLGSGVGWLLAVIGLAAIRERLAYSVVPKPLRGLGLAFIVTGLMGIGFMCFSGIKM
jgi:Na+-transporting NADH:ubiquinone oxidoreductase subunit E